MSLYVFRKIIEISRDAQKQFILMNVTIVAEMCPTLVTHDGKIQIKVNCH
ncbi:hypothetical protein CpipJ_CPIJ000076 [Culex quinquefasciatus]|uniref:Uncharacterized protein n=1 Tax=Culex quinquefasciatus TaxID=7176 RepID=B0VZC3_CULQU|nr:hypothetical protein CpipJ_CPIJ000076 [Culex quinquefasciatus]|eukprot:XP_001841746.1 hypothetical protein CpipJ_CPIJ000076 [Culex quinquefasciatus]